MSDKPSQLPPPAPPQSPGRTAEQLAEAHHGFVVPGCELGQRVPPHPDPLPQERAQQRQTLDISNRASFADRLAIILPLLGERAGVRGNSSLQEIPSSIGTRGAPVAVDDLLILSDGTILAHNLTSAMAVVLNTLNPDDRAMKQRADAMTPVPHAHTL